jgi:hypothetical protein
LTPIFVLESLISNFGRFLSPFFNCTSFFINKYVNRMVRVRCKNQFFCLETRNKQL